MTIIAVANQKGGIGKTTTVLNMAKYLAKKKKKVLAIDNDPQGNLTMAYLKNPLELKANVLSIYQEESVAPEEIEKNLFFIGANKALIKVAEGDFEIVWRLKEYLGNIKDDYDYIIIDCLPGLGHLLLAALNAADYVLVPTKAAPFAFDGLVKLFETIKTTQSRLNPNLKIAGILLNLLERTVIHKQLEDSIRNVYGDFVFKTKISKGTKLEESPAFNQSIMEYAPGSLQSKQFTQFFNEFIKRIEQ